MNEREEIIKRIRINKDNYKYKKNILRKKITNVILTIAIITNIMSIYSATFKKNTKYNLYTIKETVYDIDEDIERRYIRYAENIERGVYVTNNIDTYKLYDSYQNKLRNINKKEINRLLNDLYNIDNFEYTSLIKIETTDVNEKLKIKEYIEYLSVYILLFIGIFIYENNKYMNSGKTTTEEIIELLVEKYSFKREYINDFKKLLSTINILDYEDIYANNKDLFEISSSGLVLKLK